MAKNFTSDELFAALYRWLGIDHPGASRRFLEKHPELLSPPAIFLIRRMCADLNEPSGMIWQMFDSDDQSTEGEEERQQLRERIGLLYDIHSRGGSAQAFREAYIDVYGGVALDMPPWLENALKRLQVLIGGSLSERTVPMMISGLQLIVEQAESAPDVPPEMLAELRFYLQEMIKEAPNANTSLLQEERIAILQDILHTYTRARYPRRYAEVQHNLGLIYKERLAGNQQENVNEAIACLKRAIDVYTPDVFPKEHAMNQYNLGNVLMMAHLHQQDTGSQALLKEALVCFQAALQYYSRAVSTFEYAKIQQCLGMAYSDYVEGERFAHLEKAFQYFWRALEIFTPEAYPLNFAEVHYLLALLHKERVEYDRPEALEEAIFSCKQALQVYTRLEFPLEYAKVQNLMGQIFTRRAAGKREVNIEEEIACHQRALQVFTLESDPVEHAETLNLLGNAFRERIAGNRSENQEEAIAYYIGALEAFKAKSYAKGVAKVHYNLAVIYCDRLMGNRAENQELAIAYCLRVLEFSTRESYPDDYAQTQNMLGSIYKERIRGDVRANLEEAIQCYQRALEIYTLARFPKSYAEVQHNLGNAYFNRVAGTTRENIEEAINCYRRALQVFTRENLPVQYATTHIQLGIAYRERIQGERRANQEEALVCFERALQILTLEGTPIEFGKAHHNLANVYKERIQGKQGENQEAAIHHYTEAMRVNTLQNFPDGYAMAEDSLGVIYSHRLAGDRRANLEYAIACHQRALKVFTPEAFPLEYARSMSNLGITYTQHVEGNPDTNLKEAIRCFQEALKVFTPEAAPLDHANTLRNLGVAYMMISGGEQRYHLERAIESFEQALHFITAEDLPVIYAEIQNNLGVAYKDRIVGKHWKNAERAINCHKIALQVFTFEDSPLDYAKTQNNLGAAYMERKLGERWENVEDALSCFKGALAAYKTDPTSPSVAGALINLGVTYASRWLGERRENLEEAIKCFTQALSIYQREAFPGEYARAQLNLGNAYARRITGEKQANLEEAITCYKRALQVFTLDSFPRQYRDTQLNLARVEAIGENWQEAHTAYQHATEAEDLLAALGTGVEGRDVILREGGDPAINDGYVLTRLGRPGEAAVSLERGRARGLAEAMALDAANPDLISDPVLRTRYEKVRRDLMSLQGIVNLSSSRYFDVDRIFDFFPGLRGEPGKRRLDVLFTEEYQKILGKFQALLQELQEAGELLGLLDTHVDEAAILRATEQCGQGHAVVYLATTSWGGIAVAALSSNSTLEAQARFASLDLPELTEELLDDLLETRLPVEKQPVSNSYGAAQAGIGFEWLLSNWPGDTFRERAMALHAACETVIEVSTFDLAAQKTIRTSWLAEIIDTPFEQMQAPTFGKLARAMEHSLLHYELQRCLEILARGALRPLVAWLQQEGVISCTFIPCGPLAAFPLLAAEIAPGKTMADLLIASVVPNARSLLGESRKLSEQSAVYALGDPHPTRQELEWAEAEAFTVAKLARKFGLRGHVKVQEKATREELIQALEKGYIVDASCHGRFDLASPLDSALILADRQYLLLNDLLSHGVDMRGLRLLVLSACQTAILDLRGPSNEVHSLAAGMIQAGAKAVLAALWSVDDMATYLLIVRFMQEWLPRIAQEPPAAALARAQHWLRTVTVRELQQWHSRDVPLSTEEERHESGSQTPGHAPEAQDYLPYFTDQSIVPKRNSRYDINQAEWEIHVKAKHVVDPDTRPYADPIYWAGFQVTGW